MARTQLSPRCLAETKRVNVGRIIIFCEGKSEKYYFDYFAEVIRKSKYTDVEVVLETADGNAQTVLNYACNFLADERNNRKFSNYAKYLAFDCDDPPNVQSVIRAAADYELLLSNYLFEIWFLMHFEEVEKRLSKRETYRHLSEHLHSTYAKGNKGKTREIIQNGSIEKAISNAQRLDDKYKRDGKTVFSNIKEMNPYTSVYKLIEQFMIELSNTSDTVETNTIVKK